MRLKSGINEKMEKKEKTGSKPLEEKKAPEEEKKAPKEEKNTSEEIKNASEENNNVSKTVENATVLQKKRETKPKTEKPAQKMATKEVKKKPAAKKEEKSTKTKASLKTASKEKKIVDERSLKERAVDSYRNRLKSYYDEMKWLYFELYRGDEEAFSYFLSLLEKYALSREEDLLSLDEERMANPNWYKGKEQYGVLLYVHNFAGNLKGVEEHLDYLKDSGFNYLQLMPILESPKEKSDGGYAVSDFKKVQEELGTMEDLRSLTKACHKEGISIGLDFVMNHTSDEHEWAKRARSGEKEFQDRYFIFPNWVIPNEFEKTVPQVFPESAPGNFTYNEEMKKVVMTTFYPYQWDLNYANPVVFNDMLDNILYLCNMGTDIFRMDAVPYIWKRMGTSCRNLPQVHTLVRLFRMAVEIVAPSVLLLGEVVMEPDKVLPYFGTEEKPGCHLLYNVTTMASTWHTLATQDTRLLQQQLAKVFALPKDKIFLNYLRCHDDIGWGLDYGFLRNFGMEEIPHKAYLNAYFRGFTDLSESRGELYNDDPLRGDARLCGTTASFCGIETGIKEKNPKKIEHAVSLDIMLHAFLLSQSGLPVIYSGDEIAIENDYSYHDDPVKKLDSRYLHRAAFPWDKAKLRKKKGSVEEKVYSGILKLEELRRKNKAFSAAADTWIIDTKNIHVLAFGRYLEGEKILCFYNFSVNTEVAYVSEVEDYVNMLSGEKLKAKDLRIPSHDFLWLKTSF